MQPVQAFEPISFAGKRLAFLGDSITDGNTHSILFEQSLRAAGIQPPTCTNVAVAGNKASDFLKRLDRDVLPFQPDYLLLSVGVNDANTGVQPETYALEVREVLDRLAAAEIQVIIMTPTPVIGKLGPTSTPRLEAYNGILNQEANQRGLRVADVYTAFNKAIAAGRPPHGGDGIHLGFDGYLVMARTTLDACGYSDVPVVETMKVEPMPGLITDWQVRPAPDADWQALTLPLPGPKPRVKTDDWWLDQERERGFAVRLPDPIGKAKPAEGRTVIASPEARQAYLNTGAGLKTIRLNSDLIYTAPGDSGWHAGRERVPVQLQAGDNVLLIEFGGSFFLSLTDTNTW